MRQLKDELAILDVGHGNSAVLVDSNGIVVVDAGRGLGLRDFLVEQGIRRIDVILVSHADEDHISGLFTIIASGEFDIGRVHLNTDSIKDTKIWSDLLLTLSRDASITSTVSLVRDMNGTYDHGNIRIEILAPSVFVAGKGPGSTDLKGRLITSNSVSAVVRLCKDGQPIVLLAGDIDQVGLSNILEEGTVDLRAPVLVYPHHGGRPGIGDAVTFSNVLCDAVKPETVIFSVGRKRYGLPREDVVDAVRKCCDGVRIACTQLSEKCADALPDTTPTHLTDVYADGKEDNSCCAGTVVVSMTDMSVTPSRSDHDEFIANAARTALCKKSHQLVQIAGTATSPLQ